MKSLFDCDDAGDMKEYVGCNIYYENWSFKFTKKVMVKIFKDEFDMPIHGTITPGEPVTTLVKAEENGNIAQKRTTYFIFGVGKHFHVMRWSRPEIYNIVRDLLCHMSVVTENHVKAMHRVMGYFSGTISKGWKMKPKIKWDIK